ncbi:MAG: hypothetical protein CMB80_15070 [Flammeovirgaceae bacterium]|nr:hypothetical protein [Flammeovirgaceae bacterium]
MSFGSANQAALRSVQESVWGTTPTSPALQAMRFTNESLNYNIVHVVSEETRSDRMIADLVKVSEDGNGDVGFELSATSFDDWLENIMAAAWGSTVNMSATDISAASADNSFNQVAAAFVSGGIVAGQYVKVAGFSTNAVNNGYFRVVSVVAAKIVVEGASLVTESAGDTIDIDGTMIRNGTTLKSATLQKHIQDSTTPHFLNFTGSRFNTLALDFEVGQIITGTFGIMSKGVTSTGSQLSGATTPAATTTDVMSGVTNISNVQIDDTASAAYFRKLSLNINNNLRPQDAIGDVQHAGIALGTLEITGDVELYFENATLLDKYINSTALRLSFLATDSSGGGYLFSLPNIRFDTGALPNQGRDTDILLTASFQAIRDATTDAMIQIDQF